MIKRFLRKIVVAIITWEARMVLKKYQPRIIAITGSVGKTSTKDAIYEALQHSLFVRKSEKSFNSEIGVPLAILGCESGWSSSLKWIKNIMEGFALIVLANHYPKWLVLEVGADHPGDIKDLAWWLKPEIVVITAIPEIPVHVESFKDQQEVVKEKASLAHALAKGGTLILGGDDKFASALKNEFPDALVLLFGIEPHNDIHASHIAFEYDEAGKPIGMGLRVEESGSSVPLHIKGRLGQQQIYPVLSAFAVAKALGIPPLTVAKALQQDIGPNGRMKILRGHNSSTIIDDSYNSSPAALRAAITTLKKIETKGKKIAILGDMLELGKFSSDAHKKAGVQIANVADVLITVGMRAKDIAKSAREVGFGAEYIQEFDTGESKEAGKIVRAMLEEGDVVLVKGSQSGIRLERAIKEIMEDPKRAKDLLVRQEPEWLATP